MDEQRAALRVILWMFLLSIAEYQIAHPTADDARMQRECEGYVEQVVSAILAVLGIAGDTEAPPFVPAD